jgi:hypothetical protein
MIGYGTNPKEQGSVGVLVFHGVTNYLKYTAMVVQ